MLLLTTLLRGLLLPACLLGALWPASRLPAAKDAADYALSAASCIRLHILASSDSPGDQQLKLAVRDAVLDTLTPYFAAAASREEAIALLRRQQDAILSLVRQVLDDCGASYPAAIEFGTFPFPRREYGSVALPAGDYQALRILLGEGAGRNWWCILFPPLCLIDAAVVPPPAAAVSQPAPAPSQGAAPLHFKLKLAELLPSPESKQQDAPTDTSCL